MEGLGGGVVDELDVAIEAGVAFDEAVEVGNFVENGGEEVVFSVGFGVWGCCECLFCILSGEFGVVEGGGVDEPAAIVGVVVYEDVSGVGATVGVEAGYLGFC